MNRFALYYLLSFTLIVYSCNTQEKSELKDDLIETNIPLELAINYQVPGDLPSSNASQKELATFAWNEFFALNWQSNWTSTQQRGTPNTSWNFATSGKNPDLAVWETYIHRTELRPAKGNRGSVNLNTGKPNYTFKDPINTTTNNVDLSNYWVNLDEDNEIGSCYVYAYDSLQIMYMAKTNLVEYNYVRDMFPNDSLLKVAANAGANPSYLKKVSLGLSCNSDTASHVVCLPCGSATEEGSIEIKTAWRKLTSMDNPDRFLTREAVYYTYTKKDGEATAVTGLFGLIGLHIIHKTQNYPSFVFASFEQVDVRQADMKTIGLDVPEVVVNGDTIKRPNIDPHVPVAVIDRAIPDTVGIVNQEAKSLITSLNAESVWQYYQLIGVQGQPLNYEQRAQDPNYFMANYGIESDSTLTFFHGSFGIPFDEKIINVIANGTSFNMGGCQGCHGQAQLGGTDFSFLLDFGAGKPVPTPDAYLSFEVAQDSAAFPSAQLVQLIKKFHKKSK